MATVRVQAVFQGASLLPEDRFINTFHFYDATSFYAAHSEACLDAVESFYCLPYPTDEIGSGISPYVLRDFELRAYDLSEPEGSRIPTIRPEVLQTAAGNGLPEEVALVVTLKGDPPDTARRRGRIYIGPLTNSSNVIQTGTTGEPARVETEPGSLCQILLLAATAMAENEPVGWSIRSTVPSENFVRITNGHIDNAWDTQRRRGPDASARELWAIGT